MQIYYCTDFQIWKGYDTATLIVVKSPDCTDFQIWKGYDGSQTGKHAVENIALTSRSGRVTTHRERGTRTADNDCTDFQIWKGYDQSPFTNVSVFELH